MRIQAIFLAVIMFVAFACARNDWDQTQSWNSIPNPGGDGPAVLYEPDAKPIPQLPFPNNVLCKSDDSTATGLRLNIPITGDTEFEKHLRRRVDQLDGFGTFAPITVSFSKPLDLTTIREPYVVAVDIQEGSSHFGEVVTFDLRRGYFPIELPKSIEFFPNDPMADATNFAFKPGNRTRFYEDETDTLLLKPIIPLRQQSKYAVVLSRKIKGEDGAPIRPPNEFEKAYFPQHEKELQPAFLLLERKIGLKPEDVAFAWVFTTQSITKGLELIRDGLSGRGPLSNLASDYPPRIDTVDYLSVETDGDGNPFTLKAKELQNWFYFVWNLLPEIPGLTEDIFAKWEDLSNVDYFVAGTFTSPDFTATDDGAFVMDLTKGEAEHHPGMVPFLAAIPRPVPENNFAQPPYPTVIFQHGNERNRIDLTLLANAYAKYGFATIGIDAPDHGPEAVVAYIMAFLRGELIDLPKAWQDFAVRGLAELILHTFYPSIPTDDYSTQGLVRLIETRTIFGALDKGRGTDVNGDGIPDSGQDFFTADIFHTRDLTRQASVDLMQLTKLIKNLGADWNGDGKINMEEGDFNMDGVLDFGGPDNEVFYAGTSMGGILGALFMASSEDVKAGVLNVPGGGLVDLVQSSNLVSVFSRVFTEVLGVAVAGRFDSRTSEVVVTIDRDPMSKYLWRTIYPGGAVIHFENLKNGVARSAQTSDLGEFLVSIPADKGDPLRISVEYPEGREFSSFEFNAPHNGLGLQRNTPSFRNFLDIAQHAIDAGDPINYSPHWFLEPLPGNEPKNVLVQVDLGDWTVPVSTGVALSRSAGLIGESRMWNLVQMGILNGAKNFTYEQVNEPEESKFHHGFRLYPGGNHAFLYWPTITDPYAEQWTFAAKEQMGIFFATQGEIIEDDLNKLQ